MKRNLLILTLVALIATLLPSCRSKKDATASSLPVGIEADGADTWKSVSVPVKLELLEPQKATLAGRLTMVRDEYALVSLRMLGFEVAQIYVSPTEADVIVKQVQKLWIQEPIGSRFAELNLPFSTLQEALLGQKAAFDRIPKGLDLTLGGTDANPVLTLRVKAKNQALLGRMTLSIKEAQWDLARPANFTAPGPEYKKTSLKDLEKALK